MNILRNLCRFIAATGFLFALSFRGVIGDRNMWILIAVAFIIVVSSFIPVKDEKEKK